MATHSYMTVNTTPSFAQGKEASEIENALKKVHWLKLDIQNVEVEQRAQKQRKMELFKRKVEMQAQLEAAEAFLRTADMSKVAHVRSPFICTSE